jgi:hypothetical protein
MTNTRSQTAMGAIKNDGSSIRQIICDVRDALGVEAVGKERVAHFLGMREMSSTMTPPFGSCM